jgi:peptide/nickel transport system permease protein
VALIAALILMAAAAPLAPFPDGTGFAGRLIFSIWEDQRLEAHPGPDHLGRDAVADAWLRVSHRGGCRGLMAGTFGVVLNLIAGYRGSAEQLHHAWIDTQVAPKYHRLDHPGGHRPSMLTVILVLSLNSWMVYGRMTRGQCSRCTDRLRRGRRDGRLRAVRVVLRHIL